MRRLMNGQIFNRTTFAWAAATIAVAGLAGAVKFTPKPDTAGAAAYLDNIIVDVSAALGMKLNAMTVEGREMTSRDDLLAAMDAERGVPILSIDVANARAAIEALPWVKTAKVERRLPDAVHIQIEERKPYALWQQGKRYTLVDETGKVIVDVPTADRTLPVIVGPDAPTHAAALFETLKTEAELAKRVRAAVRVGQRRWNVYLDAFEGGITIRLPEGNIGGAWTRLAGLERDHKILERDLDFIDLRLEDRLVVRVHKDPAAEPARDTKKKPVITGPKQNI